jgi:hypothetical protein
VSARGFMNEMASIRPNRNAVATCAASALVFL